MLKLLGLFLCVSLFLLGIMAMIKGIIEIKGGEKKSISDILRKNNIFPRRKK